MRIGLIYQDVLGEGGYPRDIRWLATALSDNGADVTLFTRGQRQCRTPPRGVKIESFEALGHISEDIYHVFGVFLPAQLRALGNISGKKPVVISPMGHLMPLHLRRGLLKKALYLQLLKPLFRRASCFHVFSSTEAASVIRYLGHHVRTFEANLGIFPLPAHASGLGEGERGSVNAATKFLFFGRNDVYQKGIDVLLQGFDLAIQAGAGARLVIAGKPWGKSSRFIGSFIDGKGLAEVVDVLGPVDEETKWRLFSDADYLVFLSRWDGPPRPVREALAVGTPVVVSRESNMGELVAEFNAGRVVGLEPAKVAECVLELSGNRYQWFEHRNGVARLRARLAWSRVARDYFRGYEAVLESWK